MTQKSSPNFSNDTQWEDLQCCPLCGQRAFHPVCRARDRHYGNPGLFQIVGCVSCGLHFLNPMPTVAYLRGAYPTDYYAYQPTISDLEKPRLLDSIERVLRTVLRYRPGRTGDPAFKVPGTMLDIGCGAGAFLRVMRERGWQVHGVELDSVAARRGQGEGLDIFPGTIDAARYPSSTFDYVRSNHSFEHIHNPREVLLEIRRIMKSTGFLFIGVPNVKGLMARLCGRYWWYLGAPVHPFGYNPFTLGRILSETGFKVEHVNYNSNFAGIVGSIQIYLNRNTERLGEDGWMVRNRVIRLLGSWLAKIIDFARMGDCIEVIARPV